MLFFQAIFVCFTSLRMKQELQCNLKSVTQGIHLKTNSKIFENRVVLFEFHLKFWYTNSIGIPARSLLQGRQTSNWSLLLNKKEQLLDGIQIKHL